MVDILTILNFMQNYYGGLFFIFSILGVFIYLLGRTNAEMSPFMYDKPSIYLGGFLMFLAYVFIPILLSLLILEKIDALQSYLKIIMITLIVVSFILSLKKRYKIAINLIIFLIILLFLSLPLFVQNKTYVYFFYILSFLLISTLFYFKLSNFKPLTNPLKKFWVFVMLRLFFYAFIINFWLISFIYSLEPIIIEGDLVLSKVFFIVLSIFIYLSWLIAIVMADAILSRPYFKIILNLEDNKKIEGYLNKIDKDYVSIFIDDNKKTTNFFKNKILSFDIINEDREKFRDIIKKLLNLLIEKLFTSKNASPGTNSGGKGNNK